MTTNFDKFDRATFYAVMAFLFAALVWAFIDWYQTHHPSVNL